MNKFMKKIANLRVKKSSKKVSTTKVRLNGKYLHKRFKEVHSVTKTLVDNH